MEPIVPQPSTPSTSDRRVHAALVWAVLAVAAGVPMARRAFFPAFLPRFGDWLLPILFIALPLVLLGARLGAGALDELGLTRPSLRGVAVAFAGSLAMPIAFMAAGARPAMPELSHFLRGAVVAALAEELMMRGYVFRQLSRRAGWPAMIALAASALAFGLLHIPGALLEGEQGNVLGTFLVTTAGGAWYAWLLLRWSGSLWVPVTMHLTMNLWWMLFSVGPTAGGGGSAAIWARAATITIVTVATGRLAPRASPRGEGAAKSEA